MASCEPQTVPSSTESCHVQRAVDGFSLCWSFRDGPVEAEGEEQGTKWVAVLHGMIFVPSRTKLSFESHRFLYLVFPGAALWTVDMFESVLQGQKAWSFVVAVGRWLQSRLRDRTTTVPGGGCVSCLWTSWPARLSL